MQVPYDEGIANHIGPESCAVAREGFGEALTGECTGQPLSRESFLSWVPTPCIRRKATRQGASLRVRASCIQYHCDRVFSCPKLETECETRRIPTTPQTAGTGTPLI